MKKKKLLPIVLLLIFLGLVVWSITAYVPSIKGRVVDAETGKPMEGVNVRAGWVTGYADPGGGSFRTFKVYATKTDENGEFVLPRVIKFKIPVIEIFQGIGLLAYEHEYVCQYFSSRDWRLGKKPEYYDIKLKKIRNDEEFNKNLDEIYSQLFWQLPNKTNKPDDFKYVVGDAEIFLKRYPKSGFLEENYAILAAVYIGEKEREEDYEAAIKMSEVFLKKYPNSPITSRVKEDIERFKKLLQSSPRKEDNDEK